ncbi:hypothetical protein [Algihabitans albus]|uniref:hypothetical protein n=1 Tax=Algihabitans albus TaxID=2164067 RepID=UPI000E5D1865|nr:hypothetical protein [Algihabitans albus]
MTMAGTRSGSGTYEVQVYANGHWRTVGAFDDRLLAIDEAKELAENPRFLSVKVISEKFDDLRSLYVQQTIFRSASLRDERPEFKEKQAEDIYKRIGKRHREKLGRQRALQEVRRAERRERWSSTGFTLNMTIRFLLILGLGLGALYWLLTQY